MKSTKEARDPEMVCDEMIERAQTCAERIKDATVIE